MSGSGDYISREAAKEATWENIINNVIEEQGMYGYLVNLVDKVFDAIPAADVRPVVLCRDCKYWELSKLAPSFHVCTYVCGATFVREAEDFCSRGEKREES